MYLLLCTPWITVWSSVCSYISVGDWSALSAHHGTDLAALGSGMEVVAGVLEGDPLHGALNTDLNIGVYEKNKQKIQNKNNIASIYNLYLSVDWFPVEHQRCIRITLLQIKRYSWSDILASCIGSKEIRSDFFLKGFFISNVFCQSFQTKSCQINPMDLEYVPVFTVQTVSSNCFIGPSLRNVVVKLKLDDWSRTDSPARNLFCFRSCWRSGILHCCNPSGGPCERTAVRPCSGEKC